MPRCARVQAGVAYLDVRTPEEFAAGHPPAAVSVPVSFKVGRGHTGML